MIVIHHSSTAIDHSLMSDSWNDFEREAELGHNFPTPPYDPEDTEFESMSSGESPSKSLRESLDSDSLFGELTAVNCDDVFQNSESLLDTDILDSNQVHLVDIQDDANVEMLDSFVKQIEELDIPLELSESILTCQQSNSKLESRFENSNREQSSISSNYTDSSDEEIIVGEEPAPSFVPIRSLPLCAKAPASRGKVGPTGQQPAIRMVKVSQYDQSSFRDEIKPQSRVSNPKTYSIATVDKIKRQPALKAENSILDCDVRKVPPSRKAAVQAKINREKKKAYIKCLEEERGKLLQENQILSQRTQQLEKERNKLAEETAYLRRVLFNDSQLANLLKNIGNTPDVRLSSTIMCGENDSSNKRKYSDPVDDHDYVAKRRRVEATHGSGGVCLHVDSNNVSLEFCRHCAAKSRGIEVD